MRNKSSQILTVYAKHLMDGPTILFFYLVTLADR